MTSETTQIESGKVVGIVDAGSNSLRLLIAQVYPDGRTEVLEQARQPVRLGHDTFVSGRLGQQTMRSALTVLRDYKRILNTYKVDLVRAVATSAVREAVNRDAFLDRVARAVGFDLEIIEPIEQSRLIVSAVRESVGGLLGSKKHTTMITEVGGGSTLVTVLQGGEITASQSHNVGSIRMQEMLATAGEPPVRAAQLLRQFIANMIKTASKSLHLRSVKTFLAIGGDARFAADQVGTPAGAPLQAVGRKELRALIDKCIPLRPEELARTYSLGFADAETLVPALLVYQGLLQATSADKMLVARVTMRDGLLLDLPRYISGEEDPGLHDSIVLSARTIGEKYEYDEQHAEHVTQLALRLFDELQPEHGLKPRHRLLLEVAAMLHEIGKFVSNRSHHKHSYYLISNAEIVGLRRRDIAIVSHVARYHRRSVPKSTHPEYMSLPREDRMVIDKLAAILRAADALDKGNWKFVQHFQLERQDQDLVMHVRGGVDLTLERRALALKSDLFTDIFGLKVRLEEQP